MGDLISLASLKKLLNIDDDANDSMLKLLISASSAVVETYCGRHFNDGTYAEYIDGSGLNEVYVSEWPVTEFYGLYSVDGTTETPFEVDEYRVENTTGRIILSGAVFVEGNLNYKAHYAAGYSVIPSDLQLIVAEMIGKKYKNVMDRRWGYMSVNSSGESFNIFLSDLLPDHKLLLDAKYRNRGTR